VDVAACFTVRDANRQAPVYVYFRRKNRPAVDGEDAHPRRGSADRGEIKQLNGVPLTTQPCSQKEKIAPAMSAPKTIE